MRMLAKSTIVAQQVRRMMTDIFKASKTCKLPKDYIAYIERKYKHKFGVKKAFILGNLNLKGRAFNPLNHTQMIAFASAMLLCMSVDRDVVDLQMFARVYNDIKQKL